MRADTLVRICRALKITPNEIFTETDPVTLSNTDTILDRLNSCDASEKATALSLLDVYLSSLGK